jgi:hypothetical protein
VQCTTNGHPPLISLSYRCHENLARSDPSSILHNVNSCGLTQFFRKSQTLYNKFCFSSLYHSHKDTSPGSTTDLTSTQIALRRSQNANVPEKSSRDQLQSLPAKSSSTTVTRGRVLKAHRSSSQLYSVAHPRKPGRASQTGKLLRRIQFLADRCSARRSESAFKGSLVTSVEVIVIVE